MHVVQHFLTGILSPRQAMSFYGSIVTLFASRHRLSKCWEGFASSHATKYWVRLLEVTCGKQNPLLRVGVWYEAPRRLHSANALCIRSLRSFYGFVVLNEVSQTEPIQMRFEC